MSNDKPPAAGLPDAPMGDRPGDGSLHHVIRAMREHLDTLEQSAEVRGHAVEAKFRPTWQRATEGEHRLPVAAFVVVAIGLQLVLPTRLAINPRWLLPSLEGALVLGLTAANPRRIDHSSQALRALSLALIALISLANGWSAALLVHGLVVGTRGSNAAVLLTDGAAIYVTNIIVFGLWYWEFDRGGPAARAAGGRRYPDFMFPQMANPDLAPSGWTTHFFDYLWLSYTNATAFSPTDIMPMSRWAKQIMMLQSAISLVTVALVVARAVNILK